MIADEMEVDSEELFTKKCYKCEQPVMDNLKIFYNLTNSQILLWNKFQIFVYENFDFESPQKIFVPEFQIHLVIATNNFLVCLDYTGNVHIASLKFKTSSSKLKIGFQLKEQDIKTSLLYKENHILSLKYDADTYFLCLNRISSDFHMEKKIILLGHEEHRPLSQHSKEIFLLTMHTVETNLEHLEKIFKSGEIKGNIHDLVVLSLDQFTVYGCLYSPNMIENDVSLVKLYSCPAEICNMEIIDSGELSLLIGLTMGTIIRLSLYDASKTPDIVQLNTALYKMIALKDSLVYTDGVTMWKAENIFSTNIKFTQIFVKNTNDFVKCGDQIICTTFSKLIYKFSYEDKSAYLISEEAKEYCPAEKLFNNFECLNKLFEEIDKNNEIVKKITREQDYITALALSKRQDVVKQAIESSVTVFESYEEARNAEFALTEETKEYFEADTWLVLVTISNSNIFNTLNNILSHLKDSIRIYITLSTPYKILKTTCIKMYEPLKTVNYLIPLNVKYIHTEINLNIKIVVAIPGALDNKKILTVLYGKNVVLSSEHFVKTNSKNSCNSLKKHKDTIKEVIQKINTNNYGNLFEFTDVSKLKESVMEWSFYVKLPHDYEHKFKTDNYCQKYLSQTKTDFLIQQWSSEEFLKSKSQVILAIGNEKLKVKIQNDGFSNPLLKVTGGNAKMAFNIRNFFANMIYDDYKNCEPGNEFINHTFYTTTENLQKVVKDCIKRSANKEEILAIFDQFERNVIGALPL